jgi:hypothetical protein
MDWIWIGYGLDTGLSDYIISYPYPYPIKSIFILEYPWILLWARVMGHGTAGC